ncbi:hypothetical protein Ahy_B02g058581 isoform C [Arachis hypogaea]|uniref:Uncharacterized protein n=1 Tax=Arachis hypogaea TaxID=3818 RepID=A0A445AEW7_ARAHY|nr:hypothetical protein Ahy_B02g058581 isoform C [Arachis hypogaea]
MFTCCFSVNPRGPVGQSSPTERCYFRRPKFTYSEYQLCISGCCSCRPKFTYRELRFLFNIVGQWAVTTIIDFSLAQLIQIELMNVKNYLLVVCCYLMGTS